MLVRLLPEQISHRWDTIKEAISRALPPTVNGGPKTFNNILEDLLNGEKQCWVSQRRGDHKIDAVVTTQIQVDNDSEEKTLLIYSVSSFDKLSGESWVEGFEGLRKYALSEECAAITGFTNVDKVVQIVEKLGGDASRRFLRIPI